MRSSGIFSNIIIKPIFITRFKLIRLVIRFSRIMCITPIIIPLSATVILYWKCRCIVTGTARTVGGLGRGTFDWCFPHIEMLWLNKVCLVLRPEQLRVAFWLKTLSIATQVHLIYYKLILLKTKQRNCILVPRILLSSNARRRYQHGIFVLCSLFLTRGRPPYATELTGLYTRPPIQLYCPLQCRLTQPMGMSRASDSKV